MYSRRYNSDDYYTIDPSCRCKKVKQFKKGGRAVSEKWEERTGLPWSEARAMGLTRGTLEDNLRLEALIEDGKFDNLSKRNSNNKVQTKYNQNLSTSPVPKTMGNVLQQNMDKYREAHAGWSTPKNHPFQGLENADAIHTYHKTFPSKNNYVVVDKKRGKLGVYNNGKLIREERVLTGQHEGDGDIPLSGKEGQYYMRTINGLNMTGAGIYSVGSDYIKRGFYSDEPAFLLRRQDGSQSNMAIHAPANEDRVKLYNSDPNAKKVSAGCISGRPGMCQSLREDYKIGKGTHVYILPEDAGNKLTLNPKDSILRYEVLPENIRRYQNNGGFSNTTSQKNVNQELQARRKREAEVRARKQQESSFWDYFKF